MLFLYILGIMRRCLYGWREGSYNFRSKLSRLQADQLSQMLEQCNSCKTVQFNRAIRGLKTLKFWKGSEYRDIPTLSPTMLRGLYSFMQKLFKVHKYC